MTNQEQIEDVWRRLSIGRIIHHDMTNECCLAAYIIHLEAELATKREVEDTTDLVWWLREHLCCQDVEIKTIGCQAFDPRKHCGRCRVNFKKGEHR